MTVLQHLLEADLVEIDDDSQMEKLTAAAGLVQDQLAEGRIAIAPATLVAMDPQVEVDDPVLESVYAAVTGQWPTVKKRHPDRPVAVLRGVLAQALAGGAGASDAVASVIWLTASSYAPYASVAREQEAWSRMLRPIGERSERAALTVWSGRGEESRINVSVPDLPAISASAMGLETTTLAGYLAAAAGPVEKPPQGVKPNQNVIGQGSYGGQAQPAWANTFGTTAATGITLVVNAALAATVKGLDLGPLKTLLEEHAAGISRAVADALAPLHAIELRSRVLVWREALYSKSQRLPYREIPAPLAVVCIAADLAAEVPPMSPASLDSLVWEAAHVVTGPQPTTIPVFAAALADLNDRSFADLLGSDTVLHGRKTLLSFIRSVVTEGKVPSDVRAQLGVGAAVEVLMPDLARWLFRDLRAERIAADISPRARRRRK